MKKKEVVFTLTVGIIIGSIFAGCGSYAATTYAISSNNVEYKDNSNLGATNVQAAIDGTCANVDKRLSGIEDKITKSAQYYIPLSSSRTISLSDVSNGSALLFIRIGTTLNAYMITDNNAVTNNFSTIANTYITVSLSNGVITVKNTNTTSNAVAILVGINN